VFFCVLLLLFPSSSLNVQIEVIWYTTIGAVPQGRKTHQYFYCQSPSIAVTVVDFLHWYKNAYKFHLYTFYISFCFCWDTFHLIIMIIVCLFLRDPIYNFLCQVHPPCKNITKQNCFQCLQLICPAIHSLWQRLSRAVISQKSKNNSLECFKAEHVDCFRIQCHFTKTHGNIIFYVCSNTLNFTLIFCSVSKTRVKPGNFCVYD